MFCFHPASVTDRHKKGRTRYKFQKYLERIGIKEEVIIEILTNRSNAQRLEIMDVYKGCYGEDMMERVEKIRRDNLRRVLKGLCRSPTEFAAKASHTL